MPTAWRRLLGEPFGTLILTLAVISIEVSLIASIMLHGANEPTLARDTMFAVLMIILNGMVGLALLVGALRHREQHYNLQGAKAFLAVIIPLAVLTLILPRLHDVDRASGFHAAAGSVLRGDDHCPLRRLSGRADRSSPEPVRGARRALPGRRRGPGPPRP